MAKCKRCKQDDLTWDQDNYEKTGKWRLWNPNTERPHECSKSKKNSENYGGYPDRDRKLWKTAWKPEMDLPSFRLCGICNDGTICLTNEYFQCEICVKKLNKVCTEFCPKCKKHPQIILVTSDKSSRLAS